MNAIKSQLRLLLLLFFATLSISAHCQDSAEEKSSKPEKPTSVQEESFSGGFGSSDGTGGMFGPIIQPGDFYFDGVLLKLSPQAAKNLGDSTAEQSQQLNELYNQRKKLEEQLLAKKLEYNLAVESRLSVEELQQLSQLRLEKAAESREHAFRNSLFLSGLLTIQQNQTQLQLLEGVRRNFKMPEQVNEKEVDDDEDDEDEMPPFVNHLGYTFHTTPLKPTPELVAQVLSICLNPENYRPYGGPKFCGGFHPDLCLDARNDNDSTRLMICFGCHEVILSDAGQSLKFEMDTESMRRLEALAKKIYVHRETKQP